MEYQLTLIDHPSYLHARGTGPNEPQVAQRFLREAFEACLARGLRCLLIEMDFTGPSFGMTDAFKVVCERSADGVKLRRIAYVERGREDLALARFAETVAVNRGVNVRLFPDVAAAEAWLLEP